MTVDVKANHLTV